MKKNLVLRIIIGGLTIVLIGLAVLMGHSIKLAVTFHNNNIHRGGALPSPIIPTIGSTITNPTNTTTSEKPFIKVISPNGGEVFKEDQDISIKWASKNINNVDIHAYYYNGNNNIGDPAYKEFSFNSGECRLNYEPISISTNGGIDGFVIKNGASSRCGKMPIGSRIKIEISSQTPRVADTSDNYFSIVK